MDKFTEKFFEMARWEKAIEKGVVKDIRKDQLLLLTRPSVRVNMAKAIATRSYAVSPPHTALIPKDNGDYRTVYINEPIDRIVLSIANDLLFELFPEMLHPTCKSYQSGIGCGKVVTEVSKRISFGSRGEIMGWKSDLSKYFDSVPLEFILAIFDKIEEKLGGDSPLVEVLRKYYLCDWYFDTDGTLKQKFQSLKQGCAVASWLADVLLYDLDKELSEMDGYYVRYSDDMLFVGPDYERAMEVLKERLGAMQMTLNPKKVEYLTPERWFKFLGFSIKGKNISISSTRIKKFQKEIEGRTIKSRCSYRQAVNKVNRYLYKGDGEHSWATQILPVCNVQRDLDELNKFVQDCLRAVQTGKRKVGGLGYVATQTEGCVARGLGRNVKANRTKLPTIEGYLSIGCMRKALHTGRSVYNALVSNL